MLTPSDQAAIRSVITDVFGNWSAMRPDANDPHYVADDGAVLYDVAPMKDVGFAAQKQRLRLLFAQFERFDMRPNDDLTVRGRTGMAWVTTTWRATIQMQGGQTIRHEGRATFVLELRDERWLVVHDHLSVPLPA
jgi:ketosteroid isomerase-like protein